VLFSSPFFIFHFLPLFLALYFLVGPAYRAYVLFIGSLIFYFWGEPAFCLLALVSALGDYGLCQKIYSAGTSSKKAQFYLALGVGANLGVLFYFKYTHFFLTALSQVLFSGKYTFSWVNILLPIGVSFIVFEKITYLVDVYRGKGEPARSVVDYLNYVFLFPKLLAGPIIKYHEIEKQLSQQSPQRLQVILGLKRFLLGLSKKIFIADACGAIVNPIFALPASDLSFAAAWLGIVCFTIQIYFDFSGYSDMALGLARMLGFELRENFNFPYISRHFTEFWRRWHISLSTWIREYLYIPLGGNRASMPRVYFNLWLCFLLSGLWHGANWTFVLWGAYNGLFLVCDKLFWIKLSSRLPQIVCTALTLLGVMLGWVIFRAGSLEQIQYYFLALCQPTRVTPVYFDFTADLFAAASLGAVLILLPLVPGYARCMTVYQQWQGRQRSEDVFLTVLGFLALCKVVSSAYSPFLYFKF